jgi:hypothetical protein
LFLRPEPLCAQTNKIVPDSARAAIAPDTLAQATDTLNLGARKGSVETTINYHARDSIRFDVASKIMYLFGEAHIDYGKTSLEADQIQINWETSTLTAIGTPDSTGKLIGTPFFKDGEEQYEAEKITYNYKTKRGKISGAVTKQGEGYIHAETVKKNADNTLFGKNAQYTTCDLKHPHYFINASKMKVEPGKKVITGPFNLWLGDVPTPVGFLFGLFPTPKEKASGIIIPSFGETRTQGFYLRDGGYYWAMNDYIGIKFLGDIYSYGGYALGTDVQYRKRYSYDGHLYFSYRENPSPDVPNDASTNPTSGFNLPRRAYTLNWNHNPIPRPGGGVFRANVNIFSQDGNRYSTSIGQQIASTFSSNISYSKNLAYAPFGYSIQVNHSQNTATKEVNLDLPQFSFFTSNQIYPLRFLADVPKGLWYESFTNQFNFSYRLDVENKLTNLIRTGNTADTLSYGQDFNKILQLANNGARHTFNFSLGSYKLLKYLTLNPTVNYNEAWLLKRQDYRFTDTLEIDTLNRFSRLYSYSAGANLSTRIYGTYNFKGKVKAIRHVIMPTVNYSYSPNFRSLKYDYYQWVQTDPNGRFELLSRYRGFLYDAPNQGRQSLLSFNIGNSLEMKKATEKDTITGIEKIKLIDNLNFSSAYNMAADSFNLDIIRVSMYTNLLNRISVNLDLSFDPYQYVNGRRIDKYQFQRGNLSLANFTRADLNLATDLNPDNWKREKRVPTNDYSVDHRPNATRYPELARTPEYVDFDIKWSLQVGFYTSYINPRFTQGTVSNAKNLTLNGTVNPTEKWRIQFQTGYDFENKQPSITQLNIYRDLHCWEMSINWTPFGFYQGYSVNINVKSAMLRDVLRVRRNEQIIQRF